MLPRSPEGNHVATKRIIPILEKLKPDKIKMIIGSSISEKLIEYVLDRLRIREFSDVMVRAGDVIHGKADPEIFLKVPIKLHLNPGECLVEDSAMGIEVAKRADMRCPDYRNPSSCNQDLSEADIISDDFSKLNIKTVLRRQIGFFCSALC